MLFYGFLILIGFLYAAVLGTMLSRRLIGSVWPARSEAKERKPFSDREGRYLVEVIHVKKAFDRPVLKGISLSIERGETIGVLGQSGTGKSVLLKLIAGFLRPDSGMILFKGRETTQLKEGELLEFRKRVSYVFQGGAFFDFLNVRENIAYPLREQGITDEPAVQERVDYLLHAVELEGLGHLGFDELSAGAKKQVAIARAIANNPEVILYDEPTTGVDPIIGKSLSRLIRKLDHTEHLTSVVVTHDLKCLEIVSDRIILLKDGYIRFEGSVPEFAASQDPFVVAFRTGRRFSEGESLPAA